MQDLWTALLSDDDCELAEALDRVAADEVASAVAASEFGVEPERLRDDPMTASDPDDA